MEPTQTDIRVAMLLAAGRGERLQPLTNAQPKPLLPFMGRPLIAYLLERLRLEGIERVVINLHHLADRIRRYVGDGSAWGVEVVYSSEPHLLGTAGGLKRAASALGDGAFLVLNADVLMNLNLTWWLRVHREHGALATLVLREDPQAKRYGTIGLRRDGALGRFLDTLAPGDDPGLPLMFTGASIMESTFLEHVVSDGYCDISREVYPALLQSGAPLAGVRYGGYWNDLGVPERYLQAHCDALDRRIVDLELPPPRPLDSLGDAGIQTVPPVWVPTACHVAPGASLGPYAVLGEGCSIAAGARIERSVLWDNVHVGAKATVLDCILARGVQVNARQRIEGQVRVP